MSLMKRSILVYIFCIPPFLFARPLSVEVTARSAILMNADNGKILYQKHAYVPSYPASLTKVATALYVLDRKQPNFQEVVEVADECLRFQPPPGDFPGAAYWLDTGGSTMGLKKGERVSFESLLHGLLLASGNDAANTLAHVLAPSIPHFMDELNAYLEEIGCLGTHFSNPHGLHHEEHFTTAYDICWMTKKALSIPHFRNIVSKTSYLKPKTNKQSPVELKQTNPLLKPGQYFYEKAFGVKTGYTSAALYSFVGAAKQNGRTLIAVVLGCPQRGDRYKDVVKLFETAFQEEKQTQSYFSPGQVFSRGIEGSKRPLTARLPEPLSVSFYPAEEPICKAFVKWESLDLPIHKGQKVGHIEIADEKGEILAAKDLLADEEVKGTFLYQIQKIISGWLR